MCVAYYYCWSFKLTRKLFLHTSQEESTGGGGGGVAEQVSYLREGWGEGWQSKNCAITIVSDSVVAV